MRTYWNMVWVLAALTGLTAFLNTHWVWLSALPLLATLLAVRVSPAIETLRVRNPSTLASLLGMGCGLALVGAASAHILLWAPGAFSVLLIVFASVVQDIRRIDGSFI